MILIFGKEGTVWGREGRGMYERRRKIRRIIKQWSCEVDDRE